MRTISRKDVIWYYKDPAKRVLDAIEFMSVIARNAEEKLVTEIALAASRRALFYFHGTKEAIAQTRVVIDDEGVIFDQSVLPALEVHPASEHVVILEDGDDIGDFIAKFFPASKYSIY